MIKPYRDEVVRRLGHGAQVIAEPRSLVAPPISIGVDCGPRRDSSVIVLSVNPLVIDEFHRFDTRTWRRFMRRLSAIRDPDPKATRRRSRAFTRSIRNQGATRSRRHGRQ